MSFYWIIYNISTRKCCLQNCGKEKTISSCPMRIFWKTICDPKFNINCRFHIFLTFYKYYIKNIKKNQASVFYTRLV